ncbi:DUF1801 domain-containing protein [Flavobacteriaceae bacterium F89]|uniref:DUF1801 domain-containing protein n=1 Tax=Cerina litoralis TaxID=2874477 RepID=A0AAE3JRN6_9FLAO|nr:DUF1801 domain-containing protein [Cerina litoralis]MCG2461563.1 DUF1801 domain-containing protein [Cerina litoralis]
MQYEADTPDAYIMQLKPERQEVVIKLRKIILKNLPKGFEERISYGMIGYVVPHSIYPEGYHCNPELPLPFLNLASQKNFVALYHSGIYADKRLMDWFVGQYPEHCKRKLDMGKSCIRFKDLNDIPYELIAELCTKMTVKDWISLYEVKVKRK